MNRSDPVARAVESRCSLSSNRDLALVEFFRRRHDPFHSQIRPQRFRNDHAAIGLLVILDDRHPGAPDRQSAAVQRVYELRLPLAGLRANGRAPRLVGFEIGAGGDLLVRRSGPAARLPGRTSWRTTRPDRRWIAPRSETAGPAASRMSSASRGQFLELCVALTPAARTSPAPLSETDAGG